MKEDKNNKNNEPQHKKFSSNPIKSFEEGEEGGKESTKVANQGTTNPNALGDTVSRIGDQNKPTQGAGWQSDRAGSESTGKKD
ncbi:hypothetical protein CLV24_1014 [Pontibacter ummariensis]|uniref:Uncharacterized protein n=1 Tax=Pontibacter ummariensis TaxID=1610492 RepID=A0A239AXE4_9BACT|nr:hypothetical protein [Pontibacter ummariensis]PRY16164.1 hypothetical protein CLV24_1014 [Pontibacter ummariensis]SNS00287.1 hypothetical protein SAMN06296052_1014 [Pontibacter ummariensis]